MIDEKKKFECKRGKAYRLGYYDRCPLVQNMIGNNRNFWSIFFKIRR